MKKFALVWLACAAALVINPHGWETWKYLFTHPNLRLLSTVIEWQSPFSPLVSSGIVSIFRVMIILYSATLYFALRKKDLLPALLYIAFAAYALRAVRFQADFAIVTSIGAGLTLQYFIEHASPAFRRIATGSGAAIVATVTALLLCFLIPGNQLYDRLRYHNHFGTGVDNHFFSAGMMEFIKNHDISGRLFNEFSIGGWISWERPGEKTFIDSRDIDERIADRYDSVMAMSKGFEDRLAAYGVDYIALQITDLRQNPSRMQSTLIPYCSMRKDLWKLVYWDDYSFLYLKNTDRFRGINDQFEYRVLDPYLYSARHDLFDSLKRADEPRFVSELRRKAVQEPDGVIINYFVQYARQGSSR